MEFLAPQFLWLAFAAPVVAAMLVLALWGRRRAVARFYGAGAGRDWAPRPSLVRALLSALCWSIACVCVALTLARPAHSPQPQKVERSGRDAVFVIDVSRSMLAQDLKPTRLARAQLMVGDVLDTAEGDRIGLVAFAGTPVVRCPLTTDYAFARMSLEAIGPDSIGRGGTAIGDAVRKALSLLQAAQGEGEIAGDIYLLTDGEDHETRPIEAAEEAARHGVRLITIGLGSDSGSPVPADPEQVAPMRGQSRDAYMQFGGERVQSRMDAATLRSMADATPGGTFLNVGTGNLELDRVYRLLRRDAEQKELEPTESMRYTEVFQLPLAAAICFGVFAMYIEGARLRFRLPRLAVPAGIAILLVVAAAPVRAQSVDDDIRDSIELRRAGKHGEALSLLDGAAVRHPHSAAIALERGCAHIGANQPAEADAELRRAEQLGIVSDPATAARARYNLGLFYAAQAAGKAPDDPKAALAELERSERWFRNARGGLDPAQDSSAAANIETVQRAREVLRKQIQEQQAQEQPEQNQQQSQSQSGKSGEPGGKGQQQSQPGGEQQSGGEQSQPSPEEKSAESLAKLAQQQERAASESEKLHNRTDQSAQQKQPQADKLADEQGKLSDQTAQADEELSRQQTAARAREQNSEGQQDQAKSQQEQNLSRSRDNLDQARQAQARAEEALRKGDAKGAEQAQREAAEKLRDAARAALGIDQHQGENGEESEQGEQQEGRQQDQTDPRAFNATAANILDREARQRDAIRRFLKSQQRSRSAPVEKDW